jgi:succinate-acetate transporter protein
MLRPGMDKGLATPLPLGLASLATTTFLLGVGVVFHPLTSWPPYLMQALMFGGLVELLAGMWAFVYGDALAATTFSFLGAFFGWWALVHFAFLGVTINNMAAVFIVTGVVTLYLWIASFYEFAAFNLVLLFLWVAFGLVGMAMFTGIETLAHLGGIAAIISALISAYTSFAEIYNATNLQDVLPVGEFKLARQRVERG